MKIPVLEIAKESYRNVLSNMLVWLKVIFIPLTLMFLLKLSGWSLIYIEDIQIHLLLFRIIAVFYKIAESCLNFKAYRYGVYNEGRDAWLDMPRLNQISILFIYLMLAEYTLEWAVHMELYLIYNFPPTIFGLICFLIITFLGLNLLTRLSLVFLLISIGVKKPIRKSWQLMKGNVLRLWGILMLIFSPVLIGISIITGVGGFDFWESKLTFSVDSVSVVSIIVIVSIFYGVILTKSLSLVYLSLSKDKLDRNLQETLNTQTAALQPIGS